MVSPMIVKIIPTTGKSGNMGQRTMSTRLAIPIMLINIVPVISKIKREKKPTMREIKRSRNMCNLRSRDPESEVVSAEICR